MAYSLCNMLIKLFLSKWSNEASDLPTVDGEVDPAAVVARLFAGLLVKHHH